MIPSWPKEARIHNQIRPYLISYKTEGKREVKKPLFEIKDVDRAFYDARINDFVPADIIDVHAHLWLARFAAPDSVAPVRQATWPRRVAAESPIEDIMETYKVLFPNKRVKPLIFGNCTSPGDNIEEGNDYVRLSAAAHGLPALIFAVPRWSGAELEEKILAGGFLGAKVYLSLSEPYLPESEIRIFDFLPHHQLEILDRHGWIVMLHIPRPGRIRDPVNLHQMIEIEARYPNLKLVIAHAGRAYCPEDIGNAFEMLAGTQRMSFDISANTNALVFRRLIETVGPKRIMFGSDLPITRMRMRRICENGNYVNIVPHGMYGDVSGDKHMREISADEAGRLTFFLYEEIDAFRRAAESNNLSVADIEDVFHNNAAEMIRNAKGVSK